jgi:phosphoribosylformylglycinamidine synthase
MPRALVITAAGINCEEELLHAFRLAGADAELVHLNALIDDPRRVDHYDLIGLPGGFSFGDAIAAGRVMAALMREKLYPALVRAIERGAPIIAPCNGFQIAVQMGLLPGPPPGAPWPESAPRPEATLGRNASGRFVDRWCAVEIPARTRCIWTAGISAPEPLMALPVAHGEGRFIAPELARLERDGQIALRYARGDNPNGSEADVAGICDASGLVFGLMPHPERYTRATHHPTWTRLPSALRATEPLGLRIFRNAVARAAQAAAV